MSSPLDIASGAAEPENQEVAQPRFGRGEPFRLGAGRPSLRHSIHRPENLIAGNLPVKRRDEPRETFLADSGQHLFFTQHFSVFAILSSIYYLLYSSLNEVRIRTGDGASQEEGRRGRPRRNAADRRAARGDC